MEDAIKKLKSVNDDDDIGKAVTTMRKLLKNVATGDEKFRRVKLSNKVIASKIVAVTGAVEFLVEAGFQRQDDELVWEDGDVDGALKLLEDPSFHLACVLPHIADVKCISLRETIVATACIDNVARTFDVTTGALKDEYKGHSKPMTVPKSRRLHFLTVCVVRSAFDHAKARHKKILHFLFKMFKFSGFLIF